MTQITRTGPSQLFFVQLWHTMWQQKFSTFLCSRASSTLFPRLKLRREQPNSARSICEIRKQPGFPVRESLQEFKAKQIVTHTQRNNEANSHGHKISHCLVLPWNKKDLNFRHQRREGEQMAGKRQADCCCGMQICRHDVQEDIVNPTTQLNR